MSIVSTRADKRGFSTPAKAFTVVSPLKTGLTVVSVQSVEQTAVVFAVMIEELATASSRLPVPMPECESIACMFSGPQRQLEQLRAQHVQLGLTQEYPAKIQFVGRETSSALDWCNSGAGFIVQQSKHLKKNGAVALTQPLGVEPDVGGLLHLRRIAEQKEVRIILFCAGVIDIAKYSGVANELFIAMQRDPNPGFDEAFEFSSRELGSSWNPASGKALCCVRFNDDGLDTEITPYVADDLKTRLMAILKADGWSLERIGKIVKLNKSNVSRKLRFVSATVPKGWNNAMRDEWLEACGLDPVEDDDASAEDSGGADQAGDYDDGDDLDDLDCAKPVAQASRNERNKRNEIKPKKKQR
ncbi:hypothetical protein [Comamonas testosteroni]|uniref:hypothetical protein n=1 Tax=Comamonas testosteroni TaxID=285 RepID=UPI0003762186|nr:hypothetical protein [Comamonas testosteroni]